MLFYQVKEFFIHIRVLLIRQQRAFIESNFKNMEVVFTQYKMHLK